MKYVHIAITAKGAKERLLLCMKLRPRTQLKTEIYGAVPPCKAPVYSSNDLSFSSRNDAVVRSFPRDTMNAY
jgi:hypothetical protein